MNAALRELPVIKMHATHNDFVLIDERPARIERYAELARALCDRGAGLGADGLLVLSDAVDAVARMRVFNADGSEAEMCGNGVRCAARYLAERGAGERFTIATLAGPIAATIVAREPTFRVRVEIGSPCLSSGAREQELEAEGRTWRYRSLSLGNPHIVIFLDDVDAVDLTRVGPALATHARFGHGTNVHLAESLDAHALRVRHFERGVGVTQSCGTGAVACAVAAIVAGIAASPVRVRVPGGTLDVTWKPGTQASLTGDAETIFERTISV